MLAKKALIVGYETSYLQQLTVREGLTALGFSRANIKNRYENYHKSFRIARILTHIDALLYAFSKKLDSVLICDDHIRFLEPEKLKQQVEIFKASNIKWDVMMLCGNVIPPYKRFGDYAIKVTQCLSHGCYIVARHYYATLIKNMQDTVCILENNRSLSRICGMDNFWNRLQAKHQWYFITPASIVEEIYFDYNKLKRLDKREYLLDIDKEKHFEKNDKNIVIAIFADLKNVHRIRYLIRSGYIEDLKRAGFIPFFILHEEVADKDDKNDLFWFYKDFLIMKKSDADFNKYIQEEEQQTGVGYEYKNILAKNQYYMSTFLFAFKILQLVYDNSIHGILKHDASCMLNINVLVDNCEKIKSESVVRINGGSFWLGKRILRKTVRRGEQKILNYLNSQTRIQTSFVGEKEIIAINSIQDKEVVDISFSLWNLYQDQEKMRKNRESDEFSQDSNTDFNEELWKKNLVIEKRLLNKCVKPKTPGVNLVRSGFSRWPYLFRLGFSRKKRIYTAETEMETGIQREKGKELLIRKLLCAF